MTLNRKKKKMERPELIQQIKKYFTLEELACPHSVAYFGDRAWGFFRQDYLETLLFLRRHFNTPIYCNHDGLTQRGSRCNLCNIVATRKSPYISAHVLWCAGDFTFLGYTAEEVRSEIKGIAHLLPYPVRLEKGVSWVHLDTSAYCQTGKVTEFAV